MFELLDNLTTALADMLGSPWLWLAVFVLAALDALLPFMPSETAVITVAVLLGPDPAGLVTLGVVAAIGALAGDVLGYGIGRTAGPRTLRRLQRNEKGRRSYEWARSLVHRRGTMLIVAGRYVPGGRVAVALATGSMRFPARRFVLLDAVGASIWAVYSVVIGAVGSAQFADDPVKGLLLSFAIALSTLGVIAVVQRRRTLAQQRAVAQPRLAHSEKPVTMGNRE